MESTQPRGRSRFSKPLPVSPPPPPLPKKKSTPSSPVSKDAKLPALPEEKMSAMMIPRRPVGGHQVNRSKTSSMGSVSSVYSDSPGFAQSLSDDSSDISKDSLSEIESHVEGETPPLPPKHSQRKQLQSQLPQTPKSTNNVLASSPNSQISPPPQPEIWRRRSIKSDKSISLSELKIERSNGSTASPLFNNPNPPPEISLPQLPPQLPRNFGTTRKPVPARPAPAQPQINVMGAKASKLKERTKRKDSWDDSSKSESTNENAYPSSFKQFPTPDYQHTKPQLVSPISPLTPTSNEEVPPPQIPRSSTSRSTGTSSSSTTLRGAKSIPTLTAVNSRESSDALTITSEPPIMRSPQPRKASVAHILTPQPSPPPIPSPAMTSPPATTPHTSTRTQHSRSRSSIGALYFPDTGTSAPPGTIFPAPALEVVHYDCYQQHQFMRNNKNQLCPVACMVCGKKDTTERWNCSWCCLRCCGSCMSVLAKTEGRNLRIALESIERQG